MPVKKPSNLPGLPQPFVVRVEETEEEEKSTPTWAFGIAALLITVLIMSGIIWLKFNQISTTAFTIDSPPVTAVMDIPKFTSMRDPLSVRVTIYNNSPQIASFNLTLIAEPHEYVILAENGTDAVKAENLPPGGSFTHTFKFLPVTYPTNKKFSFKLMVNDLSGSAFVPVESEDWYSQALVRYEHVYAVVNYLIAGGLLSTVAALFGDKVKKALGFS